MLILTWYDVATREELTEEFDENERDIIQHLSEKCKDEYVLVGIERKAAHGGNQ